MGLRKIDYQAIGIGEYILEGHTEKEAAEEFRIAPTTVRSRIKNLSYLKPELYMQVRKKINRNDY